jgi:hypothetical protein
MLINWITVAVAGVAILLALFFVLTIRKAKLSPRDIINNQPISASDDELLKTPDVIPKRRHQP